MALQRFCKRPIVTVTPEKTILEACRLLEERNIGCLLVEEHSKLCGILTDRDIALRVTGQGKDPQQTTVWDVITPNPVRIQADHTLHELTMLMHEEHVRRVPILDGSGNVIGIVTLDDLLALLGDEMSDMAKTVAEGLLRQSSTAKPEAYHWWAAHA
jgi:CBS domain-containing protein